MMGYLTKVIDEVREDRNRSFVVEDGMRDRLEMAMEVLGQVERREGSGGVGRFEGKGNETAGDSERIQEAWQGVYEVFTRMRREVGRMSKGV